VTARRWYDGVARRLWTELSQALCVQSAGQLQQPARTPQVVTDCRRHQLAGQLSLLCATSTNGPVSVFISVCLPRSVSNVVVVFTARRHASAVFAVDVSLSLSLSVRPSGCVTSRYCIETTGRLQLVFLAWRFSSTYPTLSFIRTVGYLQNKGTSLWNCVPNSGHRKFRHGKSIMLSTKLVDGRAC